MKVNAAINRLSGAQNNIRNAMGFLEVQDGLLETAGKIVMRMSELKGYASQDPLKGEQISQVITMSLKTCNSALCRFPNWTSMA